MCGRILVKNMLLDYVLQNTNEYIKRMPKELRKKYGQFFTSKETAVFMADMFDVSVGKCVISILDAGAGSGILATALIDRLHGVFGISKIMLVCYENDPNIIELLKSNLEWVCANSKVLIEYELRTENYIVSQAEDYNKPCANKYDLIIGNPPYMKVAKDAPEALVMSDVCYGAPNLYFLFASMGISNLENDGEMVYVIPRSWTSGAYFKKFREKLLSECAIKQIHLFESRDKVFDNEKVLQETLILKVQKSKIRPQNIIITSTKSNKDFKNISTISVPYNVVVSDKESYVYLATNAEEINILQTLNQLEDTLPSLGLKMKTGLTVDFRSRELLRDTPETETVPLFYSQHIQDGKVKFPIGRDKEYLVAQDNGLLQPNVNYLFVKRFTTKEEKRRLQCGIYLAKFFPSYTSISTQNKINFISGLQNLSICVVFGLYVIFNSTIYDRYYRILNGSTQVNSTEINSIPMPPVDTIEAMGRTLIDAHDLSVDNCDQILRRYL